MRRIDFINFLKSDSEKGYSGKSLFLIIKNFGKIYFRAELEKLVAFLVLSGVFRAEIAEISSVEKERERKEREKREKKERKFLHFSSFLFFP